MIRKDIEANCFIEYDEDADAYLLFINLLFNHKSMTIEYSNITDEMLDFLEINENYNIYNTEEELFEDIESAHFNRFLGEPRDSDRVNLLVNLRMKMRHSNGICGEDCILCNPNIGEDPFPDFTFNIRNIDTEGEA